MRFVAAFLIFCAASASIASGPPGGKSSSYFGLSSIGGDTALYALISPTDGDVLDRGLRTGLIVIRFESDRGDWVSCFDQTGSRIADKALAFPCAKDDSDALVCFEVELDTRRLPNGPNRLFFRLFEKDNAGGEDVEVLLGELTLVIHVLNTRLEIESKGVDAVRLRLQAGVVDLARLKGYRFAILAAASEGPRNEMPRYSNPPDSPPEHRTTPIPIGGPKSVGPEPTLLYPLDPNKAYALWPEGQISLRFQISWADLASVAEARAAGGDGSVFLVAAVYDGTYWDWSSIVEVDPPQAGTSLLAAD